MFIRAPPRPWSRQIIRSPQLRPEWTNLPPEIFTYIVDCVAARGKEGHATLSALSRVSKSMQVEAERALYHTLYLHPLKAHLLCKTITRHRRLWRLVRKCELVLMLGIDDYTLPGQKSLSRLSEKLLDVVRFFERLQDLCVQTSPGPRAASKTKMEIGQALSSGVFRLTTFRCGDPFDSEMQRFLVGHPTIKELYVAASRISYTLPFRPVRPRTPEIHRPTMKPAPEALQNLETLHVSTARAAELLLAKRPVVQLEISRWDEPCCAYKRAAKLARSTGPLRSLLVRTSFELEAEDVKAFATCLPNLTFLGECVFVDKVSSRLFSTHLERSDGCFDFFAWRCVCAYLRIVREHRT